MNLFALTTYSQQTSGENKDNHQFEELLNVFGNGYFCVTLCLCFEMNLRGIKIFHMNMSFFCMKMNLSPVGGTHFQTNSILRHP